MNILYKTVISLLIAAITPFALSAQQKIDPTLEVTREFDGKMMNIHKSPLETNVADSLRDFALDFNYTIFDKPYKDLYEFTPIASARIYNQTESEWPVLLLKGGVSFPFTPEAALYFQPELKKSNPNVDINIFRSAYNVHVDTLIEYDSRGERFPFLSRYKPKI